MKNINKFLLLIGTFFVFNQCFSAITTEQKPESILTEQKAQPDFNNMDPIKLEYLKSLIYPSNVSNFLIKSATAAVGFAERAAIMLPLFQLVNHKLVASYPKNFKPVDIANELRKDLDFNNGLVAFSMGIGTLITQALVGNKLQNKLLPDSLHDLFAPIMGGVSGTALYTLLYKNFLSNQACLERTINSFKVHPEKFPLQLHPILQEIREKITTFNTKQITYFCKILRKQTTPKIRLIKQLIYVLKMRNIIKNEQFMTLFTTAKPNK